MSTQIIASSSPFLTITAIAGAICAAPFSGPIAVGIAAMSAFEMLASKIAEKILSKNTPIFIKIAIAIISIATVGFCLYASGFLAPYIALSLGIAYLGAKILFPILFNFFFPKKSSESPPSSEITPVSHPIQAPIPPSTHPISTQKVPITSPSFLSKMKSQSLKWLQKKENVAMLKKGAIITIGTLATLTFIYSLAKNSPPSSPIPAPSFANSDNTTSSTPPLSPHPSAITAAISSLGSSANPSSPTPPLSPHPSAITQAISSQVAALSTPSPSPTPSLSPHPSAIISTISSQVTALSTSSPTPPSESFSSKMNPTIDSSSAFDRSIISIDPLLIALNNTCPLDKTSSSLSILVVSTISTLLLGSALGYGLIYRSYKNREALFLKNSKKEPLKKIGTLPDTCNLSSFTSFSTEKVSLDGLSYNLIPTFGDAACGIHALFGEPTIINEKPYLAVKGEGSLNQAARNLIKTQIKEAVIDDTHLLHQEWKKIFSDLIQDYLNNPTKKLKPLFKNLELQLVSLKENISKAQFEINTLIEENNNIYKEILNLKGSNKEIAAIFKENPGKKDKTILEENSDSFLNIFLDVNTELANIFIKNKSKIAEGINPLLDEFIKFKEVKEGYLNGISNIDYYLSPEEVAFAGAVSGKRIKIYSIPELGNPYLCCEKGDEKNPLVVILHQKEHFSLCVPHVEEAFVN